MKNSNNIALKYVSQILDLFHAASDEYSLVFTSGATASLKCIAESFIFDVIDNKSNDKSGNFVYLQDNHTSVLGMRDLVAQNGANVLFLHHTEAFSTFSNSNTSLNDTSIYRTNSLFVYPAESNFSGYKYPLDWIENVHKGALNNITNNKSNWYVLLDAACYVGTNKLDLSKYKPDFIVLSFYKMFGYPTGIGALIVKNSSCKVLKKNYYGGGTVNMILSTENYHVPRDTFHQRYEDGTISFLSIISLQHGLDILETISMEKISMHTFRLAQYLHHSLIILHHNNDNPVTEIYADSNYEDEFVQGGIVAFNILRSNSEYVGYMEVLHMASIFKIHLRVGCFCNPGACHRYLNLSTENIMNNYDDGFTCGGGKDLINGKPTGAVRISFGYMSTINDVQIFLMMIRKCFVDGPEVTKIPQWYKEYEKNICENIKQKNYFIKNAGNDYVDNINNEEIQEKISIKNDIELENEMKSKKQLTLVKLFIYPIKSCGAYEITDSWILNTKGLQYDREWMVMTSAGVCLTQKQEVKLCMVKPTICLEENVMKINYPGSVVKLRLRVMNIQRLREIFWF
ncbi:hypothetical protein PV327_002820 [Microctonus hyperodae]|uniref:Molybdenum cofactor sulfurase n=1 Tax=Microctonus hyperodae TaxID=165561 RepID=A0AA39KPL1_MICHY|nr:hypothetical protein PV327_002820 [Microctonus hyperodae]